MKVSEYNVMSSPSQATTGGCGGYSQSLQNIPDIMRELSTFSNSKPAQGSNSNISGGVINGINGGGVNS